MQQKYILKYASLISTAIASAWLFIVLPFTGYYAA